MLDIQNKRILILTTNHYYGGTVVDIADHFIKLTDAYIILELTNPGDFIINGRAVIPPKGIKDLPNTSTTYIELTNIVSIHTLP